MKKKSIFDVKKHTLLAIAGCVWLIAGLNVARLGIQAYQGLTGISTVHILQYLFRKWNRFFADRRIQNYQEAYRPVWYFFDLKAYGIMAFMMGGGIWLRFSGLVPDVFIAVFYTGLGCALALSGVSFWIMFFMHKS